MSNIGDHIPLEILRQVFSVIEASVRRSSADIDRSLRHDYIEPSGVAQIIPEIPKSDYKAFANFRLVSRQ